MTPSKKILSPLQLKNVKILHLNIRANSRFKEEEASQEKYGIYFKISTPKESLPEFTFSMECKIKAESENKKACKFQRVEIKVEGDFFIHPNTPEELRKKLIPYNCIAMLYSFIRGVIANTTGLFPHGAFIIPTVNFIQALTPPNNKNNK